jgi:SAM-dependent methyltransferase
MSWLWYLLGCVWLLAAISSRRRAAALEMLQPSNSPAEDHDRFLTVPGVSLDQETKNAAGAFARENGLEVLDLIPVEAPARSMLGLLQLVDPVSYRRDRFANSFPAGYAIVADDQALSRCRNQAPPQDLSGLISLGKELKRVASASSDLVIAPGLAPNRNAELDWAELRTLLPKGLPYVLWFRVAEIALITAGVVIAPTAGCFALVAYHLMIPIALAGTRLRPSGLLITTLFRIVLEAWSLAKLLKSRRALGPTGDPVEARRSHYETRLACGIDGFFERRRTECPLCGSTRLEHRLSFSDLLQGKPGRFVLEDCRDCGLVFQNPRLTSDGLDFYYASSLYGPRARAISGIHEPVHWLDVGTGHGHFCAVARDIWPGCRFDGLDMGDGVVEAENRRWVDRSVRGLFPDASKAMRGQYDVVSMYHYLEHTVDPRAELAASHEVLSPEGVLVIEVPNPECPIGRWLGRFWVSWLQPQHLHLITVDVMEQLLAEAGFEVLKLEKEETRAEFDFLFAALLLRNWAGGFPRLPWRPRPTIASRTRYFIASAALPILALPGLVLDRIASPFFRRAGVSSAYRLVARKTDRGEGS